MNGSPTITDEAAAGAAESPTITEGADEVVAATAGTGRKSARAAAAAVRPLAAVAAVIAEWVTLEKGSCVRGSKDGCESSVARSTRKQKAVSYTHLTLPTT